MCVYTCVFWGYKKPSSLKYFSCHYNSFLMAYFRSHTSSSLYHSLVLVSDISLLYSAYKSHKRPLIYTHVYIEYTPSNFSDFVFFLLKKTSLLNFWRKKIFPFLVPFLPWEIFFLFYCYENLYNSPRVRIK